MKKSISLALALIMLFSMGLPAFATERTEEIKSTAQTSKYTTTLTTTVAPSYSFSIPADVELKYGTASEQNIGQVAVSDVKHVPDDGLIKVEIKATCLVNGANTIPVTYQKSLTLDDGTVSKPLPNTITSSDPTSLGGQMDLYETHPISLTAQISTENWTAASPGKYQAKLTFEFSIPTA